MAVFRKEIMYITWSDEITHSGLSNLTGYAGK